METNSFLSIISGVNQKKAHGFQGSYFLLNLGQIVSEQKSLTRDVSWVFCVKGIGC